MKPDCPNCQTGVCYHIDESKRLAEEEQERSISWSLGDDSDCDTCGFTWNEATFDPDWHDPNEWEFSYRVGCYGGDSLSHYSEDREEKLKEMFDHLRGYPGWSREIEKTVLKMIEDCDAAAR